MIVVGSHATIRGEGRTNAGQTVAFRADVDDLSANGRLDTFAVQWPGYSAAGTLRSGNVALTCARRRRRLTSMARLLGLRRIVFSQRRLGGEMRRPALLTIAVLGGLACLLGGTVLYAAVQDTARTGTNSAESAALGTSADIQLASATKSGNAFNCGTFSEDIASGLYTAVGVSPGFTQQRQFCIKNVGSHLVELTVRADELTDVDFACTGDEAEHGDATCGGDQLGELSSVLRVFFQQQDCVTGNATLTTVEGKLKDKATSSDELNVLAAGATACYLVALVYPSDTVASAVQIAQSDRAIWRFKFSAQS